jgi:hypothetical protein
MAVTMKISVLWIVTLSSLMYLPQPQSVRTQKTLVFIQSTLAYPVTFNPYPANMENVVSS